jgi:hypothetical protein
VCWAGRSPGRLQAIRAAILVWLWVSDPLSGSFGAVDPAASQPWPRIRVLILPSHPVRHLMVRRNPGGVRRHVGLGWFALAGDDDVADAVVVQGILHALLAVATDRGDGARFSFRCVLITRLIAGLYVRGAE